MTPPYKSPRRINLVSVFFTLVIVGGAYAGWKLIPPYLQAWKVDEILREARNDASQLSALSEERRAERERTILDQTRQRILDLGVADQPDFPLVLEFSPDYDLLTARYRVVIRHPLIDKTTNLDMTRKVSMPATKAL